MTRCKRPSKRRPTAATLPVLLMLFAGAAGHAATELEFASTVIDADQSGDCKALVDLNGDGRDDAVVGGLVLKWYEAPNWTPHVIATAAEEFTTDMEAADLDGDGDFDLIVPDGIAGICWFENLGNGSAWSKKLIGPTGAKYCHDVAVGDIDGDGDLDIVGRPLDGNLYIFRQEAGVQWTTTSRAITGGECLTLADLNGNGRLDIVVNGQWCEAPVGNIITGSWTARTYDPAKLGLSAKVAAADLNGDGRIDIVLTPSEGPGEIAWYEAPTDPVNGTWIRRVLLADADRHHSLQLFDLDGDGRRDILTAQMHTAPGTPCVEVFVNPGAAGGAWNRVVIDQVPSHNLAVGDVNGDGRIDLLGCDYIGTPPVRVWLNRTAGLSAENAPPSPSAKLSLAAAPNPFNASVRLIMSVALSEPATLKIYDQGGRLVRVLVEGVVMDGDQEFLWNGRDRRGHPAPAGLYIAVMTAGRERLEHKLMLVP